MAQILVAVSDSVFPNLDLARAVVSRVGAELRMASQPTPEGIVAAAREADALLVTYAKITADMIREMKRCRIISRFGIGVDNVDIAAATRAGIVVTKVPDYCIDEVSDHAMALLLVAGAQNSVFQRAGARRPLGDAGRRADSPACEARFWAWSASEGFRSWLRRRPRRSACAW